MRRGRLIFFTLQRSILPLLMRGKSTAFANTISFGAL